MTPQHNLPLSHAFGWTEERVLPLLQQHPALALHLLTNPKQRLHFVAFVLANTAVVSDALLHDAIMLPIRVVLPRLGLPETRGLRRVLARLFGPVVDRDVYRQIAALIAEPNTAEVLAHSAEVTPALLSNLATLPICMRTHVTVQALAHLPDASEHILQWIEIVAARTGQRSPSAYQEQIGRCRSPVDLKACLTRLLDALPALEGPPPKTIGRAIRVDAPTDIRELGKRLSNCLDGFVGAEIDGSSHYYHWRDAADEAVCEVKRVGNLGWFLARPLGPENASLDREVSEAVSRAFRAAGIHDEKVVESYDDFFHAVGTRQEGGVNGTADYPGRNRRHPT